jgi:hypothetical protein
MSRQLLRTGWVVLHTRLTLQRWRGPQLRALMDAPAGVVAAAMPARAHAVLRDVQRIGAWIPGTRCFARAVASVRLLRAEAMPARLRLGVRRAHGVVQAHAWVELDAHPVGEDAAALRDFAPLQDAHPAQPWQR